MPYIGSKPSTSFVSMSKQDLTGSSGGSVTLSHAVANANEVALYINNVRQEPTESYTVSGSTLNFNGYTVSSSDDIYVIFLGKAMQTIVPPDGSVSTAKIVNNAVNLTSKVTGVLPIANGGTGNTVGSATNYVNNLTVSGTNATFFDTSFTGTALNGGAKTIKIFISQLVNSSNGYIHFRTIDANGTTDGGYGSSFSFNSGTTFNQNSGSGDANQGNAMAVGYYANTYNIMIDCQLIDPSTNHWVFFGFSNSVGTSTAGSGFSIAYNELGANNPITGFRWASTNTNGFNVSNMKYGYSYTT